MQSVVSRTMVGSPAPSQRAPRKTPSFLSLRREKDKTRSPTDFPQIDTSVVPSVSEADSYFDVYPRPKTHPHSRQYKLRPKDHSRKPSRSDPALQEHARAYSGFGETSTSNSFVKPCYTFPISDTGYDTAYSTTPTTPKAQPRPRTRTDPSASTAVPALRFSGSSSTQHTETPPQTPVDSTPYGSSFEYLPVLVAAPVAGVETMDALVDGMNGTGDVLGAASFNSRARFGIPNHHPLYQPPLPTPPPGVILGGASKTRRTPVKKPPANQSSEDEETSPRSLSIPRPRRRRHKHGAGSQGGSASTITLPSSSPTTPSEGDTPPPSPIPIQEKIPVPPAPPPPPPPSSFPFPNGNRRKSVVPSISDIIRTHAPREGQVRSRPPTRGSSIHSQQSHQPLREEPESEPDPLAEEEVDIVSRSSIDSIADEIRQTIRNQRNLKPASSPAPALQRSQSFAKRHSSYSDTLSISSPRSEHAAASSVYSSSAASSIPSHQVSDIPSFLSIPQPSPSQAVAQYLRSTRLTTLLRLTRSPHASQDQPLTVSLSDLGSQNGIPIVVFLGLGCVRHIMGLYDEMAECLGLRLITIDRWGLGRTDQRPKTAKGIMQWASIVEEVLDLMHIDKCSIMAHSAGAPYALSFANKLPDRIVGDICLMAPWVGGSEGGGYKWLKYVPNGILKTAQAAEWKLQAWMIGKPPSLSYQGIGYTAQSAPPTSKGSRPPTRSVTAPNTIYLSSPANSRPSLGSSSFSEYDDLGDFDGRFESKSTLGAQAGGEKKSKRKPSKGFLNKLKGNSPSPQTPPDDKPPLGKRLKSLRSVGSLKSKQSSSPRRSEPSTPTVPLPLPTEIGLGLDEIYWPKAGMDTSFPNSGGQTSSPDQFGRTNGYDGIYSRSVGQRSISFTSSRGPTSLPSSPTPDSTYSLVNGSGNSYQAALGNALIAASHAESAKGTHSDLLQILNHENHSWGFSYSSYPHQVGIWYGDKDERIAENAVRWMERNMGDRCVVKVVKGADHALMYKSSVVVEILERIRGQWS
ncbi:hypothetical protein PC9H_003854 [Pleurotus ostreatus]|uniref:AB hydrolase-1 domain-containing protein n=3 Tax=Pleurotus TaxID=5320 RepID=A0A067NUA4_PLEO1|nr:uncharacterized protein PC9H_003854 [Pleurotus ostreatus]KAF7437020.1 hypothetical protein PC9H_003854 [Pleurotus ostreatus]KAJ8702860.1 hypothetical protein PTI98_001534 [Pleurotus ostreatus]KDQ30595.1 hypothetical protein PLEOSDRAFT_1037555 [Pleurotus ostreatus PC15]